MKNGVACLLTYCGLHNSAHPDQTAGLRLCQSVNSQKIRD